MKIGRQNDGLQVMARVEGVLRNGRTIRRTQIDMAQLPTEVSHLSEIRICHGGELACKFDGSGD